MWAGLQYPESSQNKVVKENTGDIRLRSASSPYKKLDDTVFQLNILFKKDADHKSNVKTKDRE